MPSNLKEEYKTWEKECIKIKEHEDSVNSASESSKDVEFKYLHSVVSREETTKTYSTERRKLVN